MDFKVGDLVYTDDPIIVANCEGMHNMPAIIWSMSARTADDVALRYPHYLYYADQYHGSGIKYLRHVPSLIKELL